MKNHQKVLAQINTALASSILAAAVFASFWRQTLGPIPSLRNRRSSDLAACVKAFIIRQADGHFTCSGAGYFFSRGSNTNGFGMQRVHQIIAFVRYDGGWNGYRERGSRLRPARSQVLRQERWNRRVPIDGEIAFGIFGNLQPVRNFGSDRDHVHRELFAIRKNFQGAKRNG
jgi:hypothetical protein